MGSGAIRCDRRAGDVFWRKSGLVSRRFRLWEKKRGDRRTGSKLVGTAGEGIIFAALFLFGSILLATLATTESLWEGNGSHWTIWIWMGLLVLASLILIGGGGLIYTILMVRTTAERRRALAKRATDIELLAEKLPSSKDFPNVPRDVNLTNSPGIKLAYRLPITRSPGWQLLAVGVFNLIWNGMVSWLLVLAVRKHLEGQPDWFLTALVVPFAAIGVLAMYSLFRLLLLATAIGPTSLEISDHPLLPGETYRIYLSQAGRLSVQSLTLLLICDEEATYRQGTDTRTEQRRVLEQTLFSREAFEILPGLPYEHECELRFPKDVMHSFQSDHNAVQWRLVVRGIVEKWSSFERTFPLVVYPSVPRSPKPVRQPAA